MGSSRGASSCVVMSPIHDVHSTSTKGTVDSVGRLTSLGWGIQATRPPRWQPGSPDSEATPVDLALAVGLPFAIEQL